MVLKFYLVADIIVGLGGAFTGDIINKHSVAWRTEFPQITTIQPVYNTQKYTKQIAIYYNKVLGPCPQVKISWDKYEVIGVPDCVQLLNIQEEKFSYSSTEILQLTDTIRTHVEELFNSHSNIVAVGGGWKITNNKMIRIPVVMIYVITKGLIPLGEETIPDTLGGFSTDILEARIISTSNETNLSSVLKCGLSIGIKGDSGYGTLGCFVKDRVSNDVCLLSNAHVIAQLGTACIVQPSQIHFRDEVQRLEDAIKQYPHNEKLITLFQAQMQVLHITQTECAQFTGNAKRDNFKASDGREYGIDAATAILLSENRKYEISLTAENADYQNCGLQNKRIVPKSWYKSWETLPWQKQVIKCGCETGLTIGELRELPIFLKNNEAKDADAVFPAFIAKNLLEISPLVRPMFAAKGDSGSIVWDLEGNAVGLLHRVLNCSLKPVGIATPIYAVLDCLNVDMVFN